MARPPSIGPPSYRLHRAKGLAVVRLNGRDVYLGTHGSPESKATYQRVIAEWLANGKQLPVQPAEPLPASAFSVNELVLAYVEFAKQYDVKNGEPTGELQNVKEALKPLALLYGDAAVTSFTPSALKTVRQAMVEADICRRTATAWRRESRSPLGR